MQAKYSSVQSTLHKSWFFYRGHHPVLEKHLPYLHFNAFLEYELGTKVN